MTESHSHYSRFLLGAVSGLALTAGVMSAAPAVAAAPEAAPVGDKGQQLEEIVVTAQKRSERLQDVAISVTAISADTLQAHRFQQISDLNGLAPNVVVNAGNTGKNNITTTIRGLQSYPVAPGQSPGVSYYLDGVYLANLYGNLLDLADVQQIEVLKGPQGTLFGRSSVGGAISIMTSNPVGEFHVTQTLSGGNYDQFRSKTHVELPRMGPFSASFTYLHFQRKGDIKNLGAGKVWNLGPARDSLPYRGSHKNDILTSAKTLGDQDVDSFMGAVRFQPVDNFSMTYKFDYAHNDFTPPGLGIANPSVLPAFPLLSLMLAAQPAGTVLPVIPNLKRPKAVNNDFAGLNTQENMGHNLTTDWHINDMFQVKDILSYRKNEFTNDVQFGGDSGLTVTPGLVAVMGLSAKYPAGSPAFGTPYLNAPDSNFNDSQWINELQFLVTTPLFDLTSGWLYYKQKYINYNLKNIAYPNLNGTYVTGAGTAASPYLLSTCGSGIPGVGGGANTQAFGCTPNGGQGQQKLSTKTQALYAQAQIHITPQIDVLVGGRESWDTETYGGDPGFNGQLGAVFQKTSKRTPTWLLGVNYKPTSDMLLYVKASTGYIPGGIFSSVEYGPEDAKSYEAGIKADWLGHTVRTNLAVFHVTYSGLQGFDVTPSGVVSLTNSAVKGKAKGFEFEGNWTPATGLTLGTAVGYTDLEFSDHDLAVHTISGFAPKWTVNLNGRYESSPLNWARGGNFMILADASYNSSLYTGGCVALICGVLTPAVMEKVKIGPQWMVNGRMGLTAIPVGQAFGQDATLEVALFVKNLTNNKSLSATTADFHTFAQSGGWQPARTYGVDLTAKF